MIARRIALLATLLVVSATASRAQTAAIYGAGLQAWTGCWAREETLTPAGVTRFVCVVPSSNVNVVQVAAIEGSIVAQETLDATGRLAPLEASGCTGTRRAAWSRDSRRLFIRTTGICQGVPLATSAIFSISSSGEWIDVEGIGTRGRTSVRVARYRDVGVPAGLPPEVAKAVARNALARESTRTASAASVHIDDVIDALQLADADVVAAWIREGAQPFAITRSDVANLDLSGYSARLADALAAVADSNAMLARTNEPSVYAHDTDYDVDQSASESSYGDYYLPPWGWGAGYVLFHSRRGGRRGGGAGAQGHGGNAPEGRGGGAPEGRGHGGTVRLGGAPR
jgi:hypothetical protein